MDPPRSPGALDWGRFDALTFDCYGTLIDWEEGLHAALCRALPGLSGVARDELLEAYAAREAAAEQPPYRPYREVLAAGLRGVAAQYEQPLDDDAVQRFARSVGEWPAFADSADALRRLQQRFRLGVITNCDDDLFAASAERLGVAFDWVVTAQQVESYKPSPRNFERAFDVLCLPRERILHVAQSLFHDHVPAKRLGLKTVWIDRRHDRPGFGATPPADATPDAVFPSMRAFAEAAAPTPHL